MLTVLGECLIDLVAAAEGDRTDDVRGFIAHPGGSPLNIAVGLSRLGHPTALMARLSNDAFGRILRDHATGNGLDLTASASAEEPSTLAVVSVDEQGKAAYDFYVTATADWQWSPAELDAMPAGTSLLHTGSLAAWTQPGAELIGRLCARLYGENRVLLSYDPNVRPRLMGGHDAALPLVERSVASAHVVKASDEDVQWLYPDSPIPAVAQRWLELGAHLVVITQGPDGATAFRASGEPIHRPGRSISLVDTVGAGDAFMSGLLSTLVGVGVSDPSQLGRLDDEELVARLLDRAILVSALTCERAGANPPSQAEVERVGAG
ncbi:carbohydrate kinase [Jatrophihabitans sp. GAS493]|uniref:carbohydrate kinase family protein n=1 Tax=Jatrophihabitans sp. GAS493 TaxID=1907575 RepID=UPI000BB7531D|nr:carbohydrate kinase [Jatrophihabitans sp. GAS493]